MKEWKWEREDEKEGEWYEWNDYYYQVNRKGLHASDFDRRDCSLMHIFESIEFIEFELLYEIIERSYMNRDMLEV